MSSELDLEKQKIAERLSSLENIVSSWIAVTELKIKQDDKVIEKLCHIIIGNGDIGISEKVRNFENIHNEYKLSQVSRKKHFFLVWVAVIPVVIERIWSHIFK